VHNEFFLDKFLHISNPIVDPSKYICVQIERKKKTYHYEQQHTHASFFFLPLFFIQQQISRFLLLYLHITFVGCPQTFTDVAKVQCGS
jgi:hypothetical protein